MGEVTAYFAIGLALGSVLRGICEGLILLHHPSVVEGEWVVEGAALEHEARRVMWRATH
jgi:hypothetical protein